MPNGLIRKGLVFSVIVMFIGVSISSVTSKDISISKIDNQSSLNRIPSSKTIINNGSLSGYIKNLWGWPIEGALVNVSFHETYEEDYSDETGYYHVTNIPICYCMKNVTCSQECYITESVQLNIDENTIHDFILNTTNNPPSTPNIIGNWSIPSISTKKIVNNPTNYPPGKPIDVKFKATDPDGDNIRYRIDWDDGLSDITDFYPSGEEVIVSHTYDHVGAFTITVCAEDTCGLIGPEGTMMIPISQSTQQSPSSIISNTKKIATVDNNPPGIPIVIGPIGGKPGVIYTFTFIAVDPDGDDVRYIIDWGDGYIDTTTYAPSGFEVDASHMWEKAGVYHGSVKAEDIHGLQGPEKYIKFGRKNSIYKEDCIECQVTDGYSLLRAKLLLLKVKVVTNIVSSSRLGDIPEIKESSQEIIGVINHNKPLDDRLICRILQSLDESLKLLMDSLEKLIAAISNEQILFQLDLLNLTLFSMRIIIYDQGAMIDCWGPPPI